MNPRRPIAGAAFLRDGTDYVEHAIIKVFPEYAETSILTVFDVPAAITSLLS